MKIGVKLKLSVSLFFIKLNPVFFHSHASDITTPNTIQTRAYAATNAAPKLPHRHIATIP